MSTDDTLVCKHCGSKVIRPYNFDIHVIDAYRIWFDGIDGDIEDCFPEVEVTFNCKVCNGENMQTVSDGNDKSDILDDDTVTTDCCDSSFTLDDDDIKGSEINTVNELSSVVISYLCETCDFNNLETED